MSIFLRGSCGISEHAGWDLKIVVRPREITEYLLKAYGFKYEVLNFYKDLVRKVYGIVTNDHKFYKIAKQFDPDLFVSTAFSVFSPG